jgi:cysteine desulfurase/selenocysteine lyase
LQKSILDSYAIKQDFPILKRKMVGDNDLTYLDNAATTHKPFEVINALTNYYSNLNSNIHRAVYQLAEEATIAYEQTREQIAKFINAKTVEEIIFTRNTTESINLVAYSWARNNLKKNDIVLISELEHHSNIVPWQILSQEKRCVVDYVKLDDSGYLNLSNLVDKIESGNVKLISLSHMSNVLGTIIPIKKIIKMAHANEIPVLVDGAQSVPHMPVDVQDIDCDFLAFSAHKMLGPTGVGVLYVKKEILENMPPFMGGGDMIKEVFKSVTRYNDLPYKFEAGTQNIAGVIAFGAALNYLSKIGMQNVRDHEVFLTKYAIKLMTAFREITLYGPKDPKERGGVIAFNIADIHPHDLATIMNDRGIAIRSGHHCAQVLMQRLNVSATSRASFYIYNTREDIDKLVEALNDARRIFKI